MPIYLVINVYIFIYIFIYNCFVSYLFIFACVFFVDIRESRKPKYVVVLSKIGSSSILYCFTVIVSYLLTISAENLSFAYGG